MRLISAGCLASFLLAAPFAAPRAQTPSTEGVVTYAFRSNGKELPHVPPLQLWYSHGIAHLEGGRGNGLIGQYIDYTQLASFQVLTTKDGRRFTLKTPLANYEKARVTGDTATILGYPCRKADLVIRSNHIEVWFTRAAGLRGTPSLEVAPQLGLVLKMVRNGNFEIYATGIRHQPAAKQASLPARMGKPVDEAGFHRREIDNRFTTIPVFRRQRINFGDTLHNPAGIVENVPYRYAGGTVVLKRVHLPEHWQGLAFAELSETSAGDAYDRTGSVFVIPTGSPVSFLQALQEGIQVLPVYRDHDGGSYQGITMTDHYLPPLELMRFFTPFGVGQYNSRSRIAGYDWADSVIYRQDITELLPRLEGDVWIGVYIGNYDKGGHLINLNLKYYPGDEPASDTISTRHWIEPVFNTVNLMEMAGQNYGRLFGNDSLTVRVYIPDSLKTLRLRYISTGHGGWGGGDEFNPKMNTLFVDGQKVYAYIPWRSDCATFRLKNPSSGNFGNGMSSSDYSRSGWCPGTSTNPVDIPLKGLSPGWHVFQVAIPMGKPAGNSFSAWNVSGVLIGTF